MTTGNINYVVNWPTTGSLFGFPIILSRKTSIGGFVLRFHRISLIEIKKIQFSPLTPCKALLLPFPFRNRKQFSDSADLVWALPCGPGLLQAPLSLGPGSPDCCAPSASLTRGRNARRGSLASSSDRTTASRSALTCGVRCCLAFGQGSTLDWPWRLMLAVRKHARGNPGRWGGQGTTRSRVEQPRMEEYNHDETDRL